MFVYIDKGNTISDSYKLFFHFFYKYFFIRFILMFTNRPDVPFILMCIFGEIAFYVLLLIIFK